MWINTGKAILNLSRNHKAKDIKASSNMVVIVSATSSQVEQALKDGHCVTKSESRKKS
jgi:hypothetical protein